MFNLHGMIATGIFSVIQGILEIVILVFTDLPTVLNIGLAICALVHIVFGFFAAYGAWHRTSYLLKPFMAMAKSITVACTIAIIFSLCSHINYETAIDNFKLWDRRTHPDDEERKTRIALGLFTAAFATALLISAFHFVFAKKCYRYLKSEEVIAKHRPTPNTLSPPNPNDRLAARMNDRHVIKSNYF
uniref:MARVEL domain-containing protein n=1 Tax=Steinernema glaseri TaxID=37863 RepID=A0A1I8AWH1_9BILA